MGPEHVRDPAYLVMCADAGKQRQSQEQLGKDTRRGPDIHGAVVRCCYQYFRCSIKSRLDVLLRRATFDAC